MIEFLTQFSIQILGGIPPLLYFAVGRAMDSGTFREWMTERRFAIFATAFIYFVAAVLMVGTEIDVVSAFSTVFAVPVIGGSVGFGGAVSWLLFRKVAGG